MERRSKSRADKKDWREVLLSRLWRGKNGDALSVPFFLLLGAGVAILLGGLWFALGSSDKPIVEGPVEVFDTEYDGPRHALTGARTDEEVRPAVFAVMVENALDAWPLSGVEDAFVVYEAPVEGDITRFMLLFGADQEVDQVGPVRSARPYYVTWAQDWDALYAHVGGSSEALEQIQDEGVYDLNEFYNASSFWRATGRFAPHNVYTESLRLQEAWERIVGTSVELPSWLFQDACDTCETVAHEIDVPFNGGGYDVTWKWDPETMQYHRWQSGMHQRMTDGDLLSAENVLILATDIQVIDAVGRKRIDVDGPGEGVLLQNGDVVSVSWSRSNGRMIVEEENGRQVRFNPGQTWIQVMSDTKDVIRHMDGSEEVIL